MYSALYRVTDGTKLSTSKHQFSSPTEIPRMHYTIALIISLLISLSNAATIKGVLTARNATATDSDIPFGARLVVNDCEHEALVRKDGSFRIHDVNDGEHVLSVIAHGLEYPRVRQILKLFPFNVDIFIIDLIACAWCIFTG